MRGYPTLHLDTN